MIKQSEDAYNSIKFELDLEKSLKDCDLLIETIAEIPEDKIEFYKKVAPLLEEKTIIVTNSSTLLPSKFAEFTGRPAKFLALHFANSIWKNNTAEIMGHEGTDQKCYDTIVEFAARMGMIPLKLKKEQPGYILNSLLVPLLTSAQVLFANGVADFETIDLTWRLATGAPMGPFKILDIVGLDTAYNIVSMNPLSKDQTSAHYKVVQILKEYIDNGKKGISTGE